jgi:hypothetical protein
MGQIYFQATSKAEFINATVKWQYRFIFIIQYLLSPKPSNNLADLF